MPCSKTELKTFVEWSQQPPRNLFEPVIHVIYRGLAPGQEGLSSDFVGDLTYVPLLILPPPPGPGQPGIDLHSFFYGNLFEAAVNVGTTPTHVVIDIVLSDNILISLQRIEGHTPVARFAPNITSCSQFGNTLSIETEAGPITLNKAWFLHVPIIRGRG